eukprot:1391218-Rhodomonas_salina.2
MHTQLSNLRVGFGSSVYECFGGLGPTIEPVRVIMSVAMVSFCCIGHAADAQSQPPQSPTISAPHITYKPASLAFCYHTPARYRTFAHHTLACCCVLIPRYFNTAHNMSHAARCVSTRHAYAALVPDIA